MKQFYQSVLSSYGQGEAAFIERLEKETVFVGHAKDLLRVQKQSGTKAAVDKVSERLAMANFRSFQWCPIKITMTPEQQHA